jgi:murein DD-endopeptidase MepM/ murein hydrolase activator NlpD
VFSACTARPLGRRPKPTGPAERSVVFPLAVEVAFSDTFGAPRSGGRTHQGQDLMAPKGTATVAVADGTITWMKHTNDGNAGNYLVLTDADGWEYWYIHLNNDSPGTDDGRNRYDQAFVDGIRKGQKVKAGEIIGWVGDSGNAESSGAHLHFEVHDPTDVAINGFNILASASLDVRGPADLLADAPFGNLDSVVRSPDGTLQITGWGIDRHLDDPIQASVYVDGNPVATVTADLARPDLETTHPGRGERHGAKVTGVAAAPGARVCLVLHSLGGGGNTRVGCSVAG